MCCNFKQNFEQDRQKCNVDITIVLTQNSYTVVETLYCLLLKIFFFSPAVNLLYKFLYIHVCTYLSKISIRKKVKHTKIRIPKYVYAVSNIVNLTTPAQQSDDIIIIIIIIIISTELYYNYSKSFNN